MAKRKDRQPAVSEQLRQAIRASGKSVYKIASETGVTNGQLSRFLRGERGITSGTMDALCAYLGLELRQAKRKGE